MRLNKNGIVIETMPDFIRCSYYIGNGLEIEAFFDTSKQSKTLANNITLDELLQLNDNGQNAKNINDIENIK